MPVIVAQALGALIFLVGSLWLGSATRRRVDKNAAERASRVSHLLFWMALVLPGAIGAFYPGLTRYDELLGIPSLPARPFWLAVVVVLLLIGLGLMAVSNRFLIRTGKGAAAFLLTQELVIDGIYGRTRNPMSLGFYVACVGLGVIAGSTTLTLAVLSIIIPIHLVNLKYFEERELELRYGQRYAEYRRRVPFLLPRLMRKQKAHA
ncbi:MAG: hypothetical protein JSU87_09205 [Gemmatimonadota bacterium]|nr:MAG: hypothetical protein JSU87_09205 [Gemmatimonadota bacterium]